MLTLASAIALSSLLGSLHCVGMCGPFALWATQGGSSPTSIAFYHLGRLTTYLSAGLAAGVVGSALSIGGEIAGFQTLAAKVAGGILIFVGISRLLLMLPVFQRAPAVNPKPSWVSRMLGQAKPILASRGPSSRAYLVGLISTWLPCGWLYLFVLVAAGTGSVPLALTVMIAFWVGTLPALTGLMLGARSLVTRFRRALPLAAGILLIVVGLYTATGRAAADLSSMVAPPQVSQQDSAALIELSQQPLPCCQPET